MNRLLFGALLMCGFAWTTLSIAQSTNTAHPAGNLITVNGHVAFMGISLTESPVSFKQKLRAKGFKVSEEYDGNVTMTGQVNGIPSRVYISKNEVLVTDLKSYRQPQAKTRYQQQVKKMEAIYGKGTPGEYNDDYMAHHTFKVGTGEVGVNMHNEDELEGASDFYVVSTCYVDHSDSSADPTPMSSSDDKIFEVVEVLPSYPDGANAMYTFISKNVIYPAVAKANRIQGRVIVSFVVEKDGSISNPVIVKSVDPSLDEEALRVIKAMPKWIPGRQKGETVRVKYTVPITFRLP